jgi:hypothetical protein
MDKCCGKCGWWGVDLWPEDEGVRLPVFKEGFALCGGAPFVRVTADEYSGNAMSVIDGDGWSADLITRKDHFCNEWKPKEDTT